MSQVIQFLSVKIPVLAGAGILGVSLFGAGAGLLGFSFPVQAQIAAACAGAVTAMLALRRR